MRHARTALLLAVLALLLSACTGYVHNDVHARYEVDATCGTSVTYRTNSGTAQEDTSSSWSYERYAANGDFLYVSAQLYCDGVVTVRILTWDNFGEDAGWKLDKETTSSGLYKIATVSSTY